MVYSFFANASARPAALAASNNVLKVPVPAAVTHYGLLGLNGM